MDARGRILQEERELLERAGELMRRVVAVVELAKGVQDVFRARALEVGVEDTVGIVEIADDLLEAGEVLRELRIERRMACEER